MVRYHPMLLRVFSLIFLTWLWNIKIPDSGDPIRGINHPIRSQDLNAKDMTEVDLFLRIGIGGFRFYFFCWYSTPKNTVNAEYGLRLIVFIVDLSSISHLKCCDCNDADYVLFLGFWVWGTVSFFLCLDIYYRSELVDLFPCHGIEGMLIYPLCIDKRYGCEIWKYRITMAKT